ncbi:MAG: hypothetical protein SWH78_04640 [Thermodesulfobacteriota bacterium]|nr:hypothetical protein [Thermodesulfobacteriota bacterium]
MKTKNGRKEEYKAIGFAEDVVMHAASTDRKTLRFLTLNTCQYSFLHFILKRFIKPVRNKAFSRFAVPFSIVSVLIGVLPVLWCFVFSPARFWPPSTGNRLYLLRDFNVTFGYIVLLPLLIAFLVWECSLIPQRLTMLVEDGILETNSDAESYLCDKWSSYYLFGNLLGQLVGLAVGVFVSLAMFHGILNGDDSWQAVDGQWILPGLFFPFIQVPLMCVAVTLYIVRSIVTISFLFDVVKNSMVHIHPFSADNAGGLSPIAVFGLRNQYVLAAVGINLALLLDIANRLTGGQRLIPLAIALSSLFLLSGPVVFALPLVPFRRAMADKKKELMEDIGQAMHIVFKKITDLGPDQCSLQDEIEKLKRLTDVQKMARAIPVWPFDTVTIRCFAVSYVAPVIAFVANPALPYLINLMLK